MSDRIFGLRPVLEAIEAGKTIDKLMVQKGLQGDIFFELMDKVEEYQIPVQHVPVQKLNRLTGKNHQGVYAFLSPIDFYNIENVLPRIYEEGKNPLILILDRVTDVRNFGAIARTAEATGVDTIIVPEKGSASINADAVKTSAGALYNIPVCKVKSLKETVKFLQLSGIAITCASEKTPNTLYDVNFSGPTAVVMGSEDDGVSNELLRISNNLAKLPMYGEIGSLNVSVACGAFLYEVIRQRIAVNKE